MDDDFQFERDKIDLYKRVRDRSASPLSPKHLRQYDAEFLAFTGADPTQSVLQIGCGSGLFLRFLAARGFTDVTGVDSDEGLGDVLADLKDNDYVIALTDGEAYVDRHQDSRTFDRIVLLDILEHLALDDGARLLGKLKGMLETDGKILIRVPNATSPWGIRMQFDTFDHVTPYAPGRLRELALLAGYDMTAIAGQTTGKPRKVFFQRCLHWILSRLLPYHPEIWEAALVCTFEKKAD
jgi:2-polyprenyl-3-methyl-5-hydroxy-6-metoxy-1,4-benzoquinol methylase